MSCCLNCSKPLDGMKDAARRKYCCMRCLSEHRTAPPRNRNTGHQQAQRMKRGTACERCGGTKSLQRHHKDRNPLNNEPLNIEVLCSACHHQEHAKAAPLSTCAACGQPFKAASHRNQNKICSAPCVAEWGRICAARRWSKAASAGSGPMGTRSTQSRRKPSSKP